MAMSQAYLKALASFGSTLVSYVGLVDDQGQELSGTPYERQAAAWTIGPDGAAALSSNLTFRLAMGSTVAGWRGFPVASGGKDYGGADLPAESFAGPGQYTLLAPGTRIEHKAA